MHGTATNSTNIYKDGKNKTNRILNPTNSHSGDSSWDALNVCQRIKPIRTALCAYSRDRSNCFAQQEVQRRRVLCTKQLSKIWLASQWLNSWQNQTLNCASNLRTCPASLDSSDDTPEFGDFFFSTQQKVKCFPPGTGQQNMNRNHFWRDHNQHSWTTKQIKFTPTERRPSAPPPVTWQYPSCQTGLPSGLTPPPDGGGVYHEKDDTYRVHDSIKSSRLTAAFGLK